MHAILHSYFLATFSLLFLLSVVCMYIFLALLLYLLMQFYSNTERENDRWTVETSFITRVNFHCKINFKELVDSYFILAVKNQNNQSFLF